MKKTENQEKKKQKIDPVKLFARILAGVLLVMMVAGSFYTLFYYLLNAAK